MKEDPLTSKEALAKLAENASRLVALTTDVPAPQLEEEFEPAWSVRVVVGLMSTRAELWGRWIKQILTEDHPTFSFDLTPKITHYRRASELYLSQSDRPRYGAPEPQFDEVLRVFSDRRRELLEMLSALTPDQWERNATFEVSGRPASVSSVRWLASELARREETRLDQIGQLLDL